MSFLDERDSTYLSKVIDSLCDQYNGIFLINIETMKIHIIKHSDYIIGLKDSLLTNESYSLMMEKYIIKNVLPDDYKKLEFAVNFENLVSRLKDTGEFEITYRTNRNSIIERHSMKCLKVLEKGNFNEIILAFTKAEKGYEGNSSSAEVIVGDRIRRKVLVVEDNDLNREMMKAILEDSYDVLEAENGLKGLEILSNHVKEISAVVLDMYMPVCNGFEFLEKVQNDALLKTIPIIVTTGSDNSDDEVKCLSLGASDFITKPYKPKVVLGRLQSLIRLHESVGTLSAIEYDFKTGMYTKEAFIHYADVVVANAGSTPLHLVCCEAENLEFYGITFGERIRDEILAYLAKKFKEIFINAIAFRKSNQFYWLISNNFNSKKIVWDDVVSDIITNAPVQGLILRFALYPAFDKNIPILSACSRVSQAIDKIRNSPDNFMVYDNMFAQRLLLQQNMETSFDEAIEKNEFVAFLQPKYSTTTNKIIGAEALVRWMKDGTIKYFPSDFISTFEKDGLIVRLDEYIFSKIVNLQKNRIEKGLPLVPISVNLSRTSLFHVGTIEKYASILKNANVPFDLVPIEITESAAVGNMQIKSLANKMVKFGFSLHMDDFGTGYSSLSSLNTLPFSVIKIDKSMVDYIGNEKGDLILAHTILLAHQLGMQIIAEGVENKSQVDFLVKNNCDAIQGYYFSKPVPIEDFIKMI